MTDPELLSAAIKASGLSVRGFWREYLTGQPGIRAPNIRTVWRWLNGSHAMPPAVRQVCERALEVREKIQGLLAKPLTAEEWHDP